MSGFLRPSDDNFLPTWVGDKSDNDPSKNTTFIYNPRANWSIPAQKKNAPIVKSRDHILYLLEQFQVVVVVGETGCGKSTQIPQYIVEAGWCNTKGSMIGITEPRRIAVTTLATRVAEECNSTLGERVGYSIRFDECFSRTETKIKYMTEGILIREMMEDPLLKNYSVIMLDEVHERTVEVDIIMGLIKRVLRKRSDLRVIISSATVDAEYIRDFFNNNDSLETEKVEKSSKATVLCVEGTSYSVDLFYLQEPCPDYVKSCVDTVLKIHKAEPPGDILVFLTGMDEIDQCISYLNEHKNNTNNKSGMKLLPLPMHGSLPPRDQLKVFQPSVRGHRKVVVATNIAETSITIEGIAYVVDSCFVKMKWFNPETSVDALIVTEISKASAQQRTGRAGRTRPGQCFRLCREEDFEKLSLNTPPEMQRTDLAMPVLLLKALGISNLVRFEFPSAPPSKNLIAALELLFALGALNEKGELTIPLGEQMSELPIHPALSKMLINSSTFNCMREISIIVAMLQVDNVFQTPSSQAAKARSKHREFEVEEGDLITYLNVFLAFASKLEEQGEECCKHWCSTHFLKYKTLQRANQLLGRLRATLKRFGFSYQDRHKSMQATGDDVRRCIVSGLFPNAAYLHPSGVYRTVRGDIPLHMHPTSVLYALKPPSWLVYSELIHTNKLLMKDITSIEPSWLEVLAPHYYEKKTVQSLI